MLADIQMEKLEYLGIADKVDRLVTSEEAGVDKPGSGDFLAGDAQMPLSAGGDRHGWRQLPHDIQGALDVGIDGVWLNWTDKPKPVGGLSYTEVTHSSRQRRISALCSDKLGRTKERHAAF